LSCLTFGIQQTQELGWKELLRWRKKLLACDGAEKPSRRNNRRRGGEQAPPGRPSNQVLPFPPLIRTLEPSVILAPLASSKKKNLEKSEARGAAKKSKKVKNNNFYKKQPLVVGHWPLAALKLRFVNGTAIWERSSVHAPGLGPCRLVVLKDIRLGAIVRVFSVECVDRVESKSYVCACLISM